MSESGLAGRHRREVRQLGSLGLHDRLALQITGGGQGQRLRRGARATGKNTGYGDRQDNGDRARATTTGQQVL
ncbi:MAG: hypothetical protein QM674_00450 [Burkholderiaceae bacterium]